MTLWLVIILALFLIWMALAPRKTKSNVRTLRDASLNTPALPKRYKAMPPESIRLLVNEAIRAREAAADAEGKRELHEFGRWVNALAKNDLKTFGHELNESAHRSNVDLEWAAQGHVTPDLTAAMHDVVLFHGLGIWRARAFAPLVRLEEYLAHPNTRENQRFAQQVFGKLSQTHPQLVPPSMLLAADKERNEYMHQAIERAWKQDQPALIHIVRNL